jgi:phage shock protein PspC (stress-responsive transcriptional regulator)
MVDMSNVHSEAGGAGPRPDPFPGEANCSGGFGPYRPAATRRLERKRQGRWVAGVCAGLADYLQIDATVVRVVITVLALFAGLGPLAYVVCWVLMPEEGDTESIAERLMNSTGGR